jgi:uncharacterized coiled-coil DUF342 family protein
MTEKQRAQKIEELNQKLLGLREQANKLKAEARELAEKRDKLNEQFRSLGLEIVQLKSERDKLNEIVKELKQKRDHARAKAREKRAELNGLNQEIKTLSIKKPSKSPQALKKELENIEWKIQTNPLNLQEEKKLVEKAGLLETQLNIYKKFEQLKQKGIELQAEIKALETESNLCHQKLEETARKSQEIHGKMLDKISESKKIKSEADALHKLLLQFRERIKPIQEDIMNVLNEMTQLKREIRDEEEKKKRISEQALREKVEKEAREKLKRGEKLSWEEFQLLASREDETQD